MVQIITGFLIFSIISFGLSNAQCFSDRPANLDSLELQQQIENSNSEESEGYQKILYDRQMEFSLNLFHKLYKKNEKSNLFFSPHSIHQALMLALFGAKGETESQLRRALELREDIGKNELIKEFKMENYFMEARSANTTEFDLKLANKFFVSTEEPVRECVQEILDAEIERLNFVNETEDSRVKINHWVEKNTNGKIKDIVPSGSILSTTRLAIANSAYFKGTWQQQFKKSNTKVSLFYISETEVTPTLMMYQKGSFRHGASEALQSYIIELPYLGEALSMYILLPPFTPNAIEATISRLNATSLRAAIDQNELFHETIEVSLPKFRIEQSIELKKALESIGIVDLFNPEISDLSDFSAKPNLGIGSALHKSYVEVNEEGAEAASATVLIDTRSGRPLEQTRFICNHPFVFFIYDNAANTVLFLGAYRNPKFSTLPMKSINHRKH